MFINKIVCSDCHGSGYLEQYKHVEDGVCFTCGGSGLTEEVSNEQKETPNPKKHYADYIAANKNTSIKMSKNECESRIKEIEVLVKECELEWRKGNEDMFEKLEELKSEYRDIQKQQKKLRK